MTDFIKKTLDAAGPDGVVLFSKSYCPSCVRAKTDLKNIGVSPVTVELDQREDGRLIQVALMQMTGQMTVPSSWLRGKYIGGSDDVQSGVAAGLFDEVPKTRAMEYAEKAGVKPCGAQDGAACLIVAEFNEQNR
jgi:glutaredoxin 3